MQVAVLHIAAYYLGYRLARATVAVENVPLARCISLESGMQSSLLALLLASRFFHDPLVSLPCGISTIFMTLVSCHPFHAKAVTVTGVLIILGLGQSPWQPLSAMDYWQCRCTEPRQKMQLLFRHSRALVRTVLVISRALRLTSSVFSCRADLGWLCGGDERAPWSPKPPHQLHGDGIAWCFACDRQNLPMMMSLYPVYMSRLTEFP